ncbi:MAG: hypothetical protein D8M58_00630 [Calditrichaeota bacterium]|nr:MAG: hypothetical protein DWQ03_06450 [Calditrichota bacterium]MBL1203875.1 hypothetical protein [Calditrichota bacterium]NOG43707.1 protein kinase [Calditrichota bacterium]
MIGKTILHYKIIEKLGEGGMGIVYKAEDTKLERQVAIKFLPHHVAGNTDERKRFETEAKAAAALNHANIATIYAIEETDDQHFLVMEYIEGKELKEIVRAHDDSPKPIETTIDYATQIAEGLKAAHEKGIVHRDIKPANIMVTTDGKVKIMDFGLAKFRGSVQLTQVGTTVGTAAYMSPEQAKGEEVDQRSDIWSFGVVLFEMVTGVLPFKGDYEQAVIYSIINEDPQPITGSATDIPEGLEQVINKAILKDPDDRFQNITELLAELRTLKNQSNENNINTVASLNKAPKRKTPYLIFGIFVTIMLTVVIALFFFPKKEQRKTIDLIAVLPFSNNKPGPETDYLGFALADQIIGDLVYLKNIVVRSSSSVRKYGKQATDLSIAGDELKVDYILTGNFFKEANVIRLNVELIKVNNNEMVWREPIEVDFNSAFELQDIVAEKVVERLNVQFSQKEMNRIGKDVPDNPLAYEYYLRGVGFPLTAEGNQLATEMLMQSIGLDSTFAPAFSQLADRLHRVALYGKYDSEKYRRVESIYLKAISLNNDLISAQAGLAMYYAETGRIEKAVVISRHLLEINPNNADALFSLGYIYRYAGMDNESILKMEQAMKNDPRNPRFRSLSLSYCNIGEYEKALKVFELIESSDWVVGMRGYIFFKQRKKEQAIEVFNKIINRTLIRFGH